MQHGNSRFALVLLSSLLFTLTAPAFGEPPPEITHAAQAFDVLEIRVLGNTVLKPVDIERAVYPFLGPNRTFTELEQARDALVALYRTRGFGAVYIDIPEQEVTDGLVRIQVTEGRLDRVRLAGARYFSDGRIRTGLPPLAHGDVVNTAQLQDQVAQLNRQTPDRTVVPVLRAGRTPGTVDLDLKVVDTLPVHGSVEFDNRHSADTTPNRINLNLSYDNLFQAFNSLSLQFQAAPAAISQARVLAGTYAIPVDESSRFLIYALNTNSNVATLGTLSVLGAGSIYGLRYALTVPEVSKSLTQSITFGPDLKDFRDTVHLASGEDVTPIKYAVWSLSYSASYQTPSTSSAVTFSPAFGVRGLPNDSSEFAFKRFGANADFFYVRASIQHDRPLFLGTRLFARVSTQLTREPLINNEQMSLGGLDTVRGYLEADVLGDTGVAGSLEWRTGSLASLLGDRWKMSYVFAFFDDGFVRTLEALPSQISRYNLSSWGGGLRFVGGGVQASFDWARPRESTPNTAAGGARMNFDLLYGF